MSGRCKAARLGNQSHLKSRAHRQRVLGEPDKLTASAGSPPDLDVPEVEISSRGRVRHDAVSRERQIVFCLRKDYSDAEETMSATPEKTKENAREGKVTSNWPQMQDLLPCSRMASE